MSESLRDQLLKSGLARKFKSDPPRSKPPAQTRPPAASPGSARTTPQPRRERSEIDLAKAYALRDSTERAERERVQREAELRAREKKERKQRLATVLTDKALNAQNAEIPRHFRTPTRFGAST